MRYGHVKLPHFSLTCQIRDWASGVTPQPAKKWGAGEVSGTMAEMRAVTCLKDSYCPTFVKVAELSAFAAMTSRGFTFLIKRANFNSYKS